MLGKNFFIVIKTTLKSFKRNACNKFVTLLTVSKKTIKQEIIGLRSAKCKHAAQARH